MIFTPYRSKINNVYPPHNTELFEEYFFRRYSSQFPTLNREYVSIFWTGLYVNRSYGQGDISDVQMCLDALDRNKKYFTIVQYDDNILNDLSDLDILVFAQGGYGKYRERCYPIPLNCMPSPHARADQIKDIFCSFIGTIRGRHRIRENMQSTLSGDSKYFVSESLGYSQFHDIMNRSIFSLCPRGYGQTSFRICEALQHGSIPVYVYDDPLIPFYDKCSFEEYGVLISEANIGNINEVLCNISEDRRYQLIQNGKDIYRNFYDYVGCYQQVIRTLT